MSSIWGSERDNQSDEGSFQLQTGMFADAKQMKEKMRQSMTTPQYDVGQFYKPDGFCQMVARSPIFEHMTLSVIAFNALWMSIDIDLNGASMLLTAHPVFQIAEHFFCMYFTFEWAMRFGAFKRKRDGLRDRWFVFDSFMVFMMVGETWVMTAVMIMMGAAKGGGGLGNASILRLLRLLRLSRMARMAKLLRSMPELLILIKGMVTAMKSVFYTLALLCILLYIFAIAFRQLTADTAAGVKHFPSIISSMHTLLLDGTLMDSPGAVVTALLQESVVYVVLFYIFICLAALMVMNMLIGVLCEVVSAVAATEKEQIAVGTVKDGIQEIIDKGGLDTDGDGLVSRVEFEAILDDPDAIRLLDKVEVDVYGLVDLADFIFAAEEDIHGNEVEKQLTFTEFMEIVLSLRGTNTATVKDVVDLRKFIRGALQELEGKCINAQRSRRSSACSASLEAPPARQKVADAGPPPKQELQQVHVSRDEPKENKVVSDNMRNAALCNQSEPLEDRRSGEDKLNLAGALTQQMPQEVCLKAMRLEGVLAATRNQVARFIDSLPVIDMPTSPSHPASGLAAIGGLAPARPPLESNTPFHRPEDLRQLQDLRARMVRLVQALDEGLDGLQHAQQRRYVCSDNLE